MNRIPLFVACLALICVAGTKKSSPKTPPLTIRFHSEASAGDGEKFVQAALFMTTPHEGSIEVIPVISEREVVAFYPFPAKDNSGTMGAAFKLDGHGTALLEAFSVTHSRRRVLVMVNQRQVVNLVVDRPIRDGIITIPSGISPAEIETMRGEYRIIGQKQDPKKTQSKKIKRVLAGDIDAEDEPERLGPAQAKPTPIPISTPPPAPTPTPKAKR
ncbi:MAG: hypothetical protein ABI615_02755 [Chthoniobacterales bacterium]